MGRNPFRQYIPAEKHLSHGLIQLSHGEGAWEKLYVSVDRLARSQHPFCKSLRIHENEVARGHAKLSANQKHQFEFVNSEGGMPTNEGAKRATRRPSGINYYQPTFNPLKKKWAKRCIGPKTALEHSNQASQ